MRRVTLLIGVMFWAASVLGNMEAWQTGNMGTGVILSEHDATVAMQSMDLLVELSAHSAKVIITYDMVNTGEAQDLRVAFPCRQWCTTEWKTKRVSCMGEADEYSIQVDGQAVSSTKVEQVQGQRVHADSEGYFEDLAWYSSQIHFDRMAHSSVRISYVSAYLNKGESVSGVNETDEPQHFKYLFSTAKGWKGPIGRGNIRIVPLSVDAGKLSILPPNRFSKGPDGAWHWSFQDLRPTAADDLDVSLGDGYLLDTDANWTSGAEAITSQVLTRDGAWFGVVRPTKITASSVLAPSNSAGGVRRYDAECAVDDGHSENEHWVSPLETCWCEGVDGDGVGQWLDAEFDPPQRLTHIGIVPGVAASKALYYKNSRPMALELMVNGTASVSATLVDAFIYSSDRVRAWQWVKLPPHVGAVKDVKIRIAGVVSGTVSDTCISDLVFIEKLRSKPDIHRAR